MDALSVLLLHLIDAGEDPESAESLLGQDYPWSADLLQRFAKIHEIPELDVGVVRAKLLELREAGLLTQWKERGDHSGIAPQEGDAYFLTPEGEQCLARWRSTAELLLAEE